jgi:hypothetical protein
MRPHKLSAEVRLGPKFLSRNQVLRAARISPSTLTRACRIGKGDRTSYGQRRAPGLKHTFIDGCLAVTQRDLEDWMTQREVAGCRPGLNHSLQPKKKKDEQPNRR